MSDRQSYLEEVRQQLAAVGFRNVPQEVLEQFVDDILNTKQKLSSKPVMPQQPNPPKGILRNYQMQDKENRGNDQQANMPTRPTSSRQENPSILLPKSTQIEPPSSSRTSGFQKPITQHKPKDELVAYHEADDPEESYLEDEDDEDLDTATREFLNRFNGATRSTARTIASAARRYRALHVPVSSSFSRYTNTHARSGSFKRSDPVARFQQFQNQWKRDKFLQSQEAPRRLEYRYNLGMWIPEI